VRCGPRSMGCWDSGRDCFVTLYLKLVCAAIRRMSTLWRALWRVVTTAPVLVVCDRLIVGLDSIRYPGAGISSGEIVLSSRRAASSGRQSVGSRVVFRSPFDAGGTCAGVVVGTEGTAYANMSDTEPGVFEIVPVPQYHILVRIDDEQPQLQSDHAPPSESASHPVVLTVPCALLLGSPLAVVWPRARSLSAE